MDRARRTVLRSRSAAFTLIELLVVIAIIAILAAILFPVFAQAKLAAKKTVALSNVKQLGTATQIYLGDSDDTYPMAFPGYLDGAGNQRWDVNVAVPVPSNDVATGGWNTPGGQNEAGQIWQNSTQPYRKTYGLLELGGMAKKGFATDSFVATPALCGLDYNGFFHNLNASMVAAPSVAVMAWPGFGNSNLNGRALPNPYLQCTGTGPCQFNPGGPAQTGGAAGGGLYCGWNCDASETFWVFGRTLPIVRADTSAKSVSPGTTISPAVSPSPWAAPWAGVTSTGGASTYYGQCQPGNPNPVATPANARYWCYFRPDRTE